jgi:hypothetical protein
MTMPAARAQDPAAQAMRLPMGSRHTIQVQPAGPSSAAVCTCGWKGAPRAAWNMARRDGALHVEGSRATPITPLLAAP